MPSAWNCQNTLAGSTIDELLLSRLKVLIWCNNRRVYYRVNVRLRIQFVCIVQCVVFRELLNHILTQWIFFGFLSLGKQTNHIDEKLY